MYIVCVDLSNEGNSRQGISQLEWMSLACSRLKFLLFFWGEDGKFHLVAGYHLPYQIIMLNMKMVHTERIDKNIMLSFQLILIFILHAELIITFLAAKLNWNCELPWYPFAWREKLFSIRKYSTDVLIVIYYTLLCICGWQLKITLNISECSSSAWYE